MKITRVVGSDGSFADVPHQEWLCANPIITQQTEPPPTPPYVEMEGVVLALEDDASVVSCGGLLVRLKNPDLHEGHRVRICVRNTTSKKGK